MSLFRSTTVFFVLFSMSGITTGIDCDSDSAKNNPDCTNKDEYDETAWFPIKINFTLTDSWVLKEWTFWVPKTVALLLKNIMSNHIHTNAATSLGDMEYRVLKTSEKGITKEENDLRAEKKKLLLLRRQWNIRPLTEVGPGAFKNDIKNYPPGALAKEMTKLLALKKRQEDRAKDLNEGNDN